MSDDPTVTAIAVPTPFAVGRINCYLIDDDPLTLVDCGPNSATSLLALRDGIEAAGHELTDLQRIVITHQHIDHMGLAHIVAERSGAEVVALAALAPWLADYESRMDEDDAWASTLMHRHGIPDDTNTALRAVTKQFHSWAEAVEVTRTVSEGDTLEFAGRSWTVHHRPGHSPSDTVFHDAERRTLIGGDHLLGHISSNPIVSRPLDGADGPRPQALVIYQQSMAKTRDMDLDVVLPGHGDPVVDHAALIESRFAATQKRKRKIGALISDHPRTAHEIAIELWRNVALTQAFLTISEVLGHVDLLRNEGEVIEDVDGDGVVHFTTA